MLDGRAFNLRLTIALTIAYFSSPVIGIVFLVFIAKVLSTDQVVLLMKESILLPYIVVSGVAAIVYLRWHLRPVAQFANGLCGVDEALPRMRSFMLRYWLLFLARHLMGGVVVLTATKSVLHEAPDLDGWLRMLSLAVMLSSLIGLPIFVFTIDFLSLIHISEPTRRRDSSRMPSSA